MCNTKPFTSNICSGELGSNRRVDALIQASYIVRGIPVTDRKLNPNALERFWKAKTLFEILKIRRVMNIKLAYFIKEFKSSLEKCELDL